MFGVHICECPQIVNNIVEPTHFYQVIPVDLSANFMALPGLVLCFFSGRSHRAPAFERVLEGDQARGKLERTQEEASLEAVLGFVWK